MTEISVIVPCYNSAATLGRTVESLLNQTGAPAHEIILVDSSDAEESRRMLSQFESKSVRVIRLPDKTMPGPARNVGAKQAVGRTLAFIDSDAYAAPDWLARIAEATARGVRIGGGPVLLPPEQTKRPLALAQYYLQFNEFMDGGPGKKVKFVPSVNLFCERALFDQLHGFPQIRASEDVMFGLAAGKITPVHFEPSVRVHHIFRTNLISYLRNQLMLGRYILFYRRMRSRNPMYRGLIPALLLPAFLLFKFLRIVSRIFGTGNLQIISGFLFSLPVFMIGLTSWGIGFLQACFDKDMKYA